MRKITYQIALLPLALMVLVISANAVTGNLSGHAPQANSAPDVTLRAGSGSTIAFWTQNGETIDNDPPQTMDIPHLVLFRNGALTNPNERTLIVEVSGIEVPPAGVTVTLQLATQHGDPDLGGGPEHRIPVWREALWIANTTVITQTGVTAVFSHEFNGTLISGTGTLRTPTDYVGYDVAVISAEQPITNPLRTFSQDFAFLLENQWTAPLPDVQEASGGAAPDELIVYYCDMFPFRESDDDTPWLPREHVPDFVGSELVPAMVKAFQVQTDDWGFPWHPAWTSIRSGEDAGRLSVALTKEGVWYHGKAPYPYLGNASISLRVDAKHNAAYDTLTDGLVSAFHHELFHNLQRNIQQHYGGDGDVDGAGDAWAFFSEGTAMLASSVGQPGVHFAQTSTARHYMDNGNWFLGRGFLQGDLNRSYAEMNPYHAAIYWRFLYEQCGGMPSQAGVEDPAAGMDVIRRALTALYSKRIVDISVSTGLVGAIPHIMDRALADASCPFETHRESLAAFARAIYALRLEDGKCVKPGTPAGCGFYDPNHLYYDPPVGTISYTGTPITYDAGQQRLPTGVQSSYGMDFVDVTLDPAANGGSLTLEFYGAPKADAEFSVQLWQLSESPAGIIPHTNAAEMLTERNADGHLITTIPQIDTTEFSRLGLIITRVDADEDTDLVGEYTILLHPGHGRAGDSIN